MTTLRQVLYGAALLGALAVLLWTQHLRTQTEDARATLDAERITVLEQRNTRQANTITRMGADVAALRLGQQRLQETRDGIKTDHKTGQIRKQELKREDTDYRVWAEQPLPESARRLHERPALTGAAGYRELMSRRNALRPEPSGAKQ